MVIPNPSLLPLPYLLPLRRIYTRTDTPGNENTDTLPSPADLSDVPPASPYKYPIWATVLGGLGVLLACVLFAFICAGLNRRSAAKKLRRNRYPVCEKGAEVARILVGASAQCGGVWGVPGIGNDGVIDGEVLEAAGGDVDLEKGEGGGGGVGVEKKELADPALGAALGGVGVVQVSTVMEKEGKEVFKLPIRLPGIFKRWGRRERPQDGSEVIGGVGVGVEMGMLREQEKGKMVGVPHGGPEREGWVRDGEGVWVWGRGQLGEEVVGVARPERVMVGGMVRRGAGSGSGSMSSGSSSYRSAASGIGKEKDGEKEEGDEGIMVEGFEDVDISR